MVTQRSRKYMLTFQSSHIEAGWSHEKIRQTLESLKLTYYAMVDEIGNDTGQKHTHLILYRPSAIRIRTLEKLFPTVHQDMLNGSMSEARTYLLKSGKWAETEKAETTVDDTFEESGELPPEPGQGHRSDLEKMMEMVKAEYSDLDIIEEIPSLVDKLTAIQKYRQLIIEEKAHIYRQMYVVYCYGKTGAGKTRGVYAQYADNLGCVYTINSYQGTGLFDGYDSSKVKVLCLDEFRSSLPFGLLLALTDGQYQVINCRYSNRIATHDTTWIISNIPLHQQYPNIQSEEPESWKALLRRISLVRFYYDIGKYQDYTVESYYQAYRSGSLNNWESVPIEKTPFASANHEANDKKITGKGENYVKDERNLPPSNAPAK